MGTAALRAKLIKVFCESCIKQFAVDCIICGGAKFYLWDPSTALCYVQSGEPMLTEGENGESVPVVRRGTVGFEGGFEGAFGAGFEPNLSLSEMLAFIELWVDEERCRKWKMWVDRGWNCCFWENQFVGKRVEFSGSSPESCIAQCYRSIRQLSGRVAPPD